MDMIMIAFLVYTLDIALYSLRSASVRRLFVKVEIPSYHSIYT